MSYQTYNTDPAEKKIKVFQDFSGGLNTVTSHDNMTDRELTYVKNMSFDERGSVGRRTGMVSHYELPEEHAKAQMYFRHYKTASTYVELIAADGKLYVDGVDQGIEFQSERIIEAVQWYQSTFIATGSGLYEYDGTETKPVEPYAPEPLMALYVGTNGLADDPNNFLSDGVGPTLQLTGVTFSSRYGILNKPFTLTAFHSKPAEMEIEYRFEYRYTFEAEGIYHTGQDWSPSKVWSFTSEGEADMQFRIYAREVGTSIEDAAQYLVPKYSIKPAEDTTTTESDTSNIKTCNRIILHWERLILYGDTQNTNTIYISHLKQANYFPVPNTLFFETTRNEPLNTIVRFRDYLLAFTDTSTQALFGQSPTDYSRKVLNSAVGCIAPRGAVVMDNYVAFLSADGIYYLKNVGYVDDKANVARLDVNISNIVPNNARDAVAVVFEDQLHMIFPTQKQRLRYNKSMGVWALDESPYLDLVGVLIADNQLYGQRQNANIVRFDSAVYSDLGYVYPAEFETRYLDFSFPYHIKKLKELQILAKAQEEGQVATVKAYLDGVKRTDDVLEWEANLSTSEQYNTFIDKLKATGKCLRLKVRVEHNLDQYIQFLGFSIVHKLKKP